MPEETSHIVKNRAESGCCCSKFIVEETNRYNTMIQREESGCFRGSMEGARREQIDETGFSGGAKRRDRNQQQITCWPRFEDAMAAKDE